jgi:hypothetical protein
MIAAMNRIMPFFLACAAAAAPAAAAERRFTVTDFDRVQVEGPFEVVLVTGKAPSAVAIADSQAALDRLSVDVQGRTLRVRANASAWGGYPGKSAGSARLTLSTHDVSAVTVAGSAVLDVNRVRAMRFDAALSGTGRLGIGSVDVDTLMVGLIGSGTIAVAGKAKALRATVQGAGNFEASGLVVEDLDLNAATTGTVAVTARRTAKVTSQGAGEVHVLGKPACTIHQRGPGPVACGE